MLRALVGLVEQVKMQEGLFLVKIQYFQLSLLMVVVVVAIALAAQGIQEDLVEDRLLVQGRQ
jgi:hypothetical protein